MKYSIIVPTYNREKYIKTCIDSVINQTYKNLELVIVDDGSTDNTKDVINNYEDERIIYIKNDNHGIGYSRNYGLKKATGDYILFLDSDDYLDYNALEKINELINKNDSDIIVFDYEMIFENHNEKIFIKDFITSKLDDNPNLINDINLAPWAKVYKRETLINNDILFPEDIKYEDFPFVIKALKNASSIAKLNEILIHSLVHENSETLTVDSKVFDVFKGFNIVKDTLNDDIYKESLNKLMVRKITTYTVSQRTQKEKKLINKFINEGFKYLKENVPNYKNNKYYVDRPFLKKIIEKNKYLTIIYCQIYHFLKKK